MTLLSNQTLERRARHRLDKLGLKVHKVKGGSGGYIVRAGPEAWPDFEGQEKYCADVEKLLDLTDYLRERYLCSE